MLAAETAIKSGWFEDRFKEESRRGKRGPLSSNPEPPGRQFAITRLGCYSSDIGRPAKSRDNKSSTRLIDELGTDWLCLDCASGAIRDIEAPAPDESFAVAIKGPRSPRPQRSRRLRPRTNSSPTTSRGCRLTSCTRPEALSVQDEHRHQRRHQPAEGATLERRPRRRNNHSFHSSCDQTTSTSFRMRLILVRNQGVGGSNPLAPTIQNQ